MALVHAGITFLSLCYFLLAAPCIGAWLLRKLEFTISPFREFFLISAATGVASIEIGIFLVQWTQHIRKGCLFLVLLSLIPVGVEFRRIWQAATQAISDLPPMGSLEKALLTALGLAGLVEFLASLAPLTGSDALHYHFTTQKLFLELGFHPIFFLSHSFLCGQGHLLILLGLALGNESLALSFIFLGGILSALCVACLAARWVPARIALLFTLLCLVTPLVFWQICTSGSPDIWMGVFLCASAMVLLGAKEDLSWRHAALAGFLAGGVAGAKYTGCVFAATLILALLVEFRSAGKATVFFFGALVSGIWPYLRNFIWTGDPLFPFLTSRLFPERLNSFALENLRADTGTASVHHLSGAFPFLFYAGIQGGSAPAFWEFYGPIVLAFFPLTALAWRNTRQWRVLTILWMTSGVLIFATSGLARFLLPIFPLALACAAAGVFHAVKKGWLLTYRLATISVILFCILGGAGLLFYTGPSLLAAINIHNRESYLQAKVPDYNLAKAIDESLAGAHVPDKAFVFFRHLYYLRSPYVLGDPGASWMVNPDRLKTPQDFQAFFQRNAIAFVVLAPGYPKAIAAPLLLMEKEGSLIPFSKTTTDNFYGNRIAGQRQEVPVVILQFKPQLEGSAPAAQ